MSSKFLYLAAAIGLAASLGALSFYLDRPRVRVDRAYDNAPLEAYVDIDGEVRIGIGLPAGLADSVAARPGSPFAPPKASGPLLAEAYVNDPENGYRYENGLVEHLHMGLYFNYAPPTVSENKGFGVEFIGSGVNF